MYPVVSEITKTKPCFLSICFSLVNFRICASTIDSRTRYLFPHCVTYSVPAHKTNYLHIFHLNISFWYFVKFYSIAFRIHPKHSDIFVSDTLCCHFKMKASISPRKRWRWHLFSALDYLSKQRKNSNFWLLARCSAEIWFLLAILLVALCSVGKFKIHFQVQRIFRGPFTSIEGSFTIFVCSLCWALHASFWKLLRGNMKKIMLLYSYRSNCHGVYSKMFSWEMIGYMPFNRC